MCIDKERCSQVNTEIDRSQNKENTWMNGDPLANPSGHNTPIPLRDLAQRLDKTYNTVHRWCRGGKFSLTNGHFIKLECWQTELGLVSTQAALVRFRQRLNDPQYSPLVS